MSEVRIARICPFREQFAKEGEWVANLCTDSCEWFDTSSRKCVIWTLTKALDMDAELEILEDYDRLNGINENLLGENQNLRKRVESLEQEVSDLKYEITILA